MSVAPLETFGLFINRGNCSNLDQREEESLTTKVKRKSSFPQKPTSLWMKKILECRIAITVQIVNGWAPEQVPETMKPKLWQKENGRQTLVFRQLWPGSTWLLSFAMLLPPSMWKSLKYADYCLKYKTACKEIVSTVSKTVVSVSQVYSAALKNKRMGIVY